MNTYLFSKTTLPGGWITKVYTDVTTGLRALIGIRPDVVVVDLTSITEDGAIKAVRRAFDGPIVVVGTGAVAASAIQKGADDYSETLETAPRAIASASRRHRNRQLAETLDRKLEKVCMLGVA